MLAQLLDKYPRFVNNQAIHCYISRPDIVYS